MKFAGPIVFGGVCYYLFMRGRYNPNFTGPQYNTTQHIDTRCKHVCKCAIRDALHARDKKKIINYKSYCTSYDEFQEAVFEMGLHNKYALIDHPYARVEFVKLPDKS